MRSHHDPEHIRGCKTSQRRISEVNGLCSAQHRVHKTVTEKPHPSIKAWKLNPSLFFFLHAHCTHHVTRKLLFFQINLALLKGSGSRFTISMRQAQHSWGNYKLHLTLLPDHFNLGWKAISAGRREKKVAQVPCWLSRAWEHQSRVVCILTELQAISNVWSSAHLEKIRIQQ